MATLTATVQRSRATPASSPVAPPAGMNAPLLPKLAAEMSCSAAAGMAAQPSQRGNTPVRMTTNPAATKNAANGILDMLKAKFAISNTARVRL